MLKKIPHKNLLIALLIVIILVSLTFIIYQKYFIAATVNGSPISRLNVITELEKKAGKDVLDTVITQKLIAEQAKKNNITVSQADIDKELKNIEANIKSQGGTLDIALQQQGMTKDDLIEDIKIQTTISKLIKADKITITDIEIESYIKDNEQLFPADSEKKPDKNKIKEELKQQKTQTKVQEYITKLRSDAKINYFGIYKK